MQLLSCYTDIRTYFPYQNRNIKTSHKDKSRHHQELKQPMVVPCSAGDEEGWLSKILCRL